MTEQKFEKDMDFSFKNLLVPFTCTKAIVFIIVIGLILFSNILFTGFFGDDFGQLVNNAIAHYPQNIPQFFLGGTFNNGNGVIIGLYYKPLMLTVFSILYSLFGEQSFFYHFFQLTIHISNAILLFTLLKRFFKKELAFFLAVIFLIHPINADTVNYVSNLQDVLFTFFGLIAINLVVYAKQKPISLFFVCLSFFISLLAKETGIAFAFVILAYIFLFERKNIKPYLLTIPTLIAVYAFIHLKVLGIGFYHNQPFPIMRLNLLERLINIPAIINYYLTTFIVPAKLALAHQWIIKNLTFSGFFLPLAIDVVLLGLLILIFYFQRNKSGNIRILLFFVIWLLTGLLLHIQIIPLDYTVSNRWFYFPSIGLLGILGVVVMNLTNKKLKTIICLFLILATILLCLRTIIRNNNWKTPVTLAEHDLKYAPEDYSLENYLGTVYYNQGKYDQAQNHFEKSTKLAPYWDLNWNYLGLVFERKGEIQNNRELLAKARQFYSIAIKNSVNSDTSYVSLAHLLVFSADPTAEAFIIASLKKYPYSSGLWYYRAILAIVGSHNQDALGYAKNAYLYNPYNQDAVKLYAALLNGSPIKINVLTK